MRFDLLHFAADRFDKVGDVEATPIAAIQLTAGGFVFLPIGVIRKVDTIAIRILFCVRIELVVKMNSVDVVSTNDIRYDIQAVFLRGLIGRVEPHISAILPNDSRVGLRNMTIRHRLR